MDGGREPGPAVPPAGCGARSIEAADALQNVAAYRSRGLESRWSRASEPKCGPARRISNGIADELQTAFLTMPSEVVAVKTRSIRLACLAAGLGVIGSLGVSAPRAWATGNNGSATGTFIDFNGSFPGTVLANCPAVLGTDDLGLYFISGNVNQSFGTIEGDAYYVDVTEGYVPLYLGHATLWGDNKGFTATFHGSNDVGRTIDFHMTGNPRSLQQVANMRCS